MSELIGVTSVREFYQTSLKQEALLFNKVAVTYLPTLVKYFSDPGLLHPFLPNLVWLLEQGIVVNPDILGADDKLTHDKEYQRYKRQERQFKSEASSLDLKALGLELRCSTLDSSLNRELKVSPALSAVKAKQNALYSQANELEKRHVCVALRKLDGMRAVPISYNYALPISHREAKQTDTIQILLKSMPIPDEATPWEQIIEFRKDTDSIAKFLDLRNWMNETVRAKLTPIEVEEKLEYLMSQYQRHMQLHKMKTNAGTLETVLVTGAEILEDLIRFKFSKVAKALFSFKQRKLALIEGELTAPGREIAYIFKSREVFSKR